MNDGRVVSNFVIQALQNEPITVNYDSAGFDFTVRARIPNIQIPNIIKLGIGMVPFSNLCTGMC